MKVPLITVASTPAAVSPSRVPQIVIAAAVVFVLIGAVFLISQASDLQMADESTLVENNNSELSEEDQLWSDISEKRRFAMKEKEYSVAVILLNRFIEKFPESKHYESAVSSLSYLATREDLALKAEKEQKLTSILTSLSNQAQNLLELDKYQEARDLYAKYRGEFVAETAQERQKQIAVIDALFIEFERKKVALEELDFADNIEVVQDNSPELYEKVAKDILINKSLDSLKELGKGDNEALAELLNDFVNIKSTMAKFFNDKKGQVIKVTVNGKPQVLKIISADTSFIVAEQKTGKFTVKTKIPYKNISVSDQVASIASIGESSAAIYGVYKSAKVGDNKQVSRYVGKSGVLKPYFAQLTKDSEPDFSAPVKKVVVKKRTSSIADKQVEVDHKKLRVSPLIFNRRINNPNSSSCYYSKQGETVRFNVKIENKNRNAAVEDYTASMYILSRSVKDSKVYYISDSSSERVDVEPLREVKTTENYVDISYYKSSYYSHNYKYYGYLVVLETDEGEAIEVICKSSLIKKHFKDIQEMSKGSAFSVTSSGVRRR